jgi:hypothetical protein
MESPSDWLQDLRSADPDKRRAATSKIGGLTPEDDCSIECFVEAMESHNDDLVFWSVLGLGCLGSRSVAAVPLIASLSRQHSAFGVRQIAISALREISPANPVARRAIFTALSDDNPFVRREALQSCIEVGAHTDEELDQIRAMATDPDKTVSEWSEVVLRNNRIRLATAK